MDGRVAGGRAQPAVLTGLSAALVLVVLLVPNQIDHVSVGSWLRLPLEALLGVVLLLLLPGRFRLAGATLLGTALALVGLVKLLDMGFFAILARPFDPVLDWILLNDGYGFLSDTFGRVGALAAVAVTVLLVASSMIVVVRSVRRLARLADHHDTEAIQVTTVLAVVWVSSVLFNVHLVGSVPFASVAATSLVEDKVVAISDGIRDRSAFAREVAVEEFGETSSDRLLTGLAGKNVLIAFVESYGRSAVEDPELAPRVDAVLERGNRRLSAAGFGSRSAYLTSPTSGGGSWLAHATLLSGLWIDNEQRYRNLLASDRLTLSAAFRRAGWRTVGVMPGITRAWPEGAFYGYDTVYDAHHLGYRGPNFSWATMPDQYTLAEFRRLEPGSAAGRPVMGVMPLVSSHAPWAPIPAMVDEQQVGDGSIFRPMVNGPGDPPQAILTRDPSRVRSDYRRAIEYSLDSLISYLETYGDDDTVLIFLGDHQPAPIVTGPDASRDVPITVVARDPQVLDRISSWHWAPGLKPSPNGPVWPMDGFRDRFLTAFDSP